MVSFKQEMTKGIETLDQGDREVICAALFCTVNWFREVCTPQETSVYMLFWFAVASAKCCAPFTSLHFTSLLFYM